VVDAITSAAFGQDEASSDQHREMLHDREPAQLREPGGKFTSGGRPSPEMVEQASAPRAGKRPPDVRFGAGLVGHDSTP
jgi:hypothetical protein